MSDRLATAVAKGRGRRPSVSPAEGSWRLARMRRWRGESTEVVDLEGRTMVPGFIDGHAHFFGFGAQAVGANLLAPPDGEVTTIDALVEHLKAFRDGARRRTHGMDLRHGLRRCGARGGAASDSGRSRPGVDRGSGDGDPHLGSLLCGQHGGARRNRIHQENGKPRGRQVDDLGIGAAVLALYCQIARTEPALQTRGILDAFGYQVGCGAAGAISAGASDCEKAQRRNE